MLVVYSTGCMKCKILKNTLQNQEIEFIEIGDLDIISELGFKSVPMMQLDDGTLMDYNESIYYIQKNVEELKNGKVN